MVLVPQDPSQAWGRLAATAWDMWLVQFWVHDPQALGVGRAAISGTLGRIFHPDPLLLVPAPVRGLRPSLDPALAARRPSALPCSAAAVGEGYIGSHHSWITALALLKPTCNLRILLNAASANCEAGNRVHLSTTPLNCRI
jgi:hypothetical protein